jgi:formylmethanofuran dehydrogenase subunit C
MQKARVIVTEAESWARKNFQITCYGDHFSYVFYSGSRYHQVVIQVSGGELRVKTNITSWTGWLQAVVRRNFSKFVDAAFFVAGLVFGGASGVGNFLRGSVFKALTFGN